MRNHTHIVVAMSVAVLLSGVAVGAVSAHESNTVKGYELTFGGADEPVVTGERMWLELSIKNNETGEPVEGAGDTLRWSVEKGGAERAELSSGSRHGEPGVYEAPVMFTEPGRYTIHLEGTIEGNEVHTHFLKEVESRTELVYPNESRVVTLQQRVNEMENRIERLDNRTENQGQESESMPGFGVLVALFAVTMGFLARGRLEQ